MDSNYFSDNSRASSFVYQERNIDTARMTTSSSSIVELIIVTEKRFRDGDVEARKEVVDLCDRLKAKVQLTSEWLQRTFWNGPALLAQCMTAVDVKLFQSLKDAGGTGVSFSDLVKKASVEEPLLKRWILHLVAIKVVALSEGKFRSTRLSRSLAADVYQSSMAILYERKVQSHITPNALENNEYHSLASPTDEPFQAVIELVSDVEPQAHNDSATDSILDLIVATEKDFRNNEPGARRKLVDLCDRLRAEMESTNEWLRRSFWDEPVLLAYCRIAVDAKLFQHLKAAGEVGITFDSLAEKTVVIDKSMLSDLMLHLVAMKVIAVSEGNYYGTKLSHTLAAQNYQSSICFCYRYTIPSFDEFPQFFKNNGYIQPTSPTNGPFQAALGTDKPFFAKLEQDGCVEWFAAFMSVYRDETEDWFDPGFYPVNDRLIEGMNSEHSSVLLVDVGGSYGHDIHSFAKQYPCHPGKLVLQDLPEVIVNIRDKEKLPFDCNNYNFYERQPVVGARAYAMHSILHDYNDSDAIRILKNQTEALTPGYSRVLLIEIVLLEDNPSIQATGMDMMMLAHLNSRERTMADWEAILAKAGLQLVRTYEYPGVAESVLEAELPIIDM